MFGWQKVINFVQNNEFGAKNKNNFRIWSLFIKYKT